MTYKDLFELFVEKNPKLSELIGDYRPAGTWRMKIWLNNNVSLKVYYDENKDEFSIEDVIKH